MTHLDYPTCMRLAELGLPQDLHSGDWIYYRDKTPGWPVLCVNQHGEWKGHPYYKIPSLDDLLAWLDGQGLDVETIIRNDHKPGPNYPRYSALSCGEYGESNKSLVNAVAALCFKVAEKGATK